MSNKRSHTDSALPSRSRKKQRVIITIEDDNSDQEIKTEVLSSSSAVNSPTSPVQPSASSVVSRPQNDESFNRSSDAAPPEHPLPCLECAKKLLSKDASGNIIGPLRCVYPDYDHRCSECIRLGIDCNYLIWPARERVVAIQKMEPNERALKAIRRLVYKLRAAYTDYWQTSELLTQARNINCNIFRVLNELREACPEEPFGYWIFGRPIRCVERSGTEER
ncbi:hypothetical protein BJX62DRAFT_234277 [Aspergillus germanicus]